jgi:hypothetical protein
MLTGDCSGCHTTANWNSNSMPAGHMPNPANSACTVCHTAAPSDYTTATLAAISVIHTGISSGCITCHGAPNATPPVFTPSYTPKDAVLSPVHIPTSTTACESCHTPTAIAAGGFSGTTMTSAKHTAMFAVIGKTCDACHGLSTLAFYGVTNLQTRPSDHNSGQKATGDCSGCHGTTNWDGGAAKKAAAPAAAKAKIGMVFRPGAAGTSVVAAAAAQAATIQALTTQATTTQATTTQAATPTAQAIIAPRVPAQVLAAPGLGTVASLAAPGAVTALAAAPLGASMPHTGVTSNCSSCHNGVLAVGKGPTHVASNNMCENCHTTLAWLPARFDHQGVTAACSSCHNGVTAPGKPTRHVQTNQDCSACHGTISWQSALFSHVGINASCKSCHNGITATGKQLGHVVTSLDCGACHGTLNWTVAATPPRLQPLLQRPRRTTPSAGPTGNPHAANGGLVP